MSSLMPHLCKFLDHRGGIKELIGCESGHRTADHVADIVHAGLERNQANCFEPLPDLRHMLDLKPAQLDLLACSDICKALTEIFTYLADGPNLGCVADPVRDADPHHEGAWSLTPEEDAGPLEPLPVALADRCPSFLDIAGNIPKDVQAVFFFLVLLDLVHDRSQKNQRRSTDLHGRLCSISKASPPSTKLIVDRSTDLSDQKV